MGKILVKKIVTEEYDKYGEIKSKTIQEVYGDSPAIAKISKPEIKFPFGYDHEGRPFKFD